MKIIKNNYKYLFYSILTTFSLYKYFFLYLNDKLALLINILLIIILFIFYKKLYKDNKINLGYKIFIIVMSFIFVLGYSYQMTSTGKLFYEGFINFFTSLIKVVGYYYFFKTLIYYFDLFMHKEYISNFKFLDKFKKHPFLYSFIFLSICYGIFLILYYPGIINYDNANQIKEMLGLHTRYLDAINPISNSTLTNFNPIVHTFMLGGLFKLGYLMGNVNFGLFLYTFIQMLIVISIYSYIINYSVRSKIKPIYSYIILLILGIIPLFGYYSITAVKDTLYTAFLLLFTLKIYHFIDNEVLKIKDYISLFIISLLVCLFRNNGFYIVVISIPFLLYKRIKLPIIIVLLLTISSYLSFNNILLPKLGISGTSIRETLSIPFQQTARYVKYYEEELTSENKRIIASILDYDNLKNDYNEDLADPVKNKFNKDATNDDLVKYFEVWLNGLLKHPLVYIDATINNITGYFYPFDNSWKVYHKLNPKLSEAGFDYHYNELNVLRKVMHGYEKVIEYSPFGLILNIAVITWISILLFIMILNKDKYYIFLIPNIISIFFCVLSPANTYYRYIYPSLLIMVCMFPFIKNIVEKKK